MGPTARRGLRAAGAAGAAVGGRLRLTVAVVHGRSEHAAYGLEAAGAAGMTYQRTEVVGWERREGQVVVGRWRPCRVLMV